MLLPTLILASAPFLPGVRPVEDVRLVPSFRKDDRTLVEKRVNLSLSASIPSAAGATPPAEEGKGETNPSPESRGAATEWSLEIEQREKYEETVREATGGALSLARRDFKASTTRRRTREGKGERVERTEEGPLHERTLDLKRESDETTVSAGGERLQPEFRSLLEIDLPVGALLPKEKVAEGASWNAESGRFEKWIRSALWGSFEAVGFAGPLRCTYRGIADHDGEKLDAIDAEGKISGSFLAALSDGRRAWLPVTVDFKGQALFDRTAGRFVRFEGRGAFEPREAPSPDPEAVPANPRGEVELRLDVREAKEAGAGETLALRYKEGDVFTRRAKSALEMSMESFSVTMNGRAMDMGGEAPEVEVRATSDLRTVVEVLKAEGGKPTSVRVEFLTVQNKTKQKTPAGDKEEEKGAEAEGAVAVVTRDGEDVTVKVESGTLPDELKSTLTPNDFSANLLPEEPVTKGDTWTIEGGRLTSFLLELLPHVEEGGRDALRKLLDKIDGGIECRLAEQADRELEKKAILCARIPFKASLSLEPDASEVVRVGAALQGEEVDPSDLEDIPDFELQVSVEMTGEFLFAVKEGRPVSLEFQGPVRLRFKANPPQGEMEIETKVEFAGTLEASLECARGRTGK